MSTVPCFVFNRLFFESSLSSLSRALSRVCCKMVQSVQSFFLLDKQHLCTTRTRHHPHVVWHTMRIYFCPWPMDLGACHGWLMLQGNSLRLLPVRAQDGQCCQVELSSDQWIALTGSPLCLRLGENCSTWPVLSMRIV